MADIHELCDLCGNDHLSRDCSLLSRLDVTGQGTDHDEPHLAFQSLPSWVRIEGGGSQGIRLVVMGQSIPKYTRLGPLIAPHMPTLSHYSSFPLKIYHPGGGCTYLDLTRKHLCNWLSLIPVGSPSNRNLLACQIDDLLYYMAAEDVSEGSELKVWYTPFYQEKMKEELKALGYKHSLVGSAIVTRKMIQKQQAHQPQMLQVSPTLSKIIVGKGQVTFTHNAKNKNTEAMSEVDFLNDPPSINHLWGREEDNSKSKASFPLGNRVAEEHRRENTPKTILLTNEEISKPSIELINEKGTQMKERIVTFTITAAASDTRRKQHQRENCIQTVALDASTESDARQPDNIRSNSTLAASGKKIGHKLREIKPEVSIAKSDIVKQLPPRALGARDPQPWSCRYCGENFNKVITFAKHLKAHLLWLVGRCHVCQTCGGSFSTSQQLERHCQTSHGENMKTFSDGSINNEVAVKFENLSDEESMVDDPDGVVSSGGLKEVRPIPTEQMDRPHDCQICRKHFHKAEYLLRHLKKHTGDFTCQNCLKVFARKEGLQKHNCPRESKKSLQCTLCSREFLNAVLLQQHYVKHNGNRKCDRCKRTFANSSELDRHMKSCPSVEVSAYFECGICGKDFVNQTILDRHMAGHTRQYQCEICSKPYRSSTKLAQHVPLCRQSQQVASTGQVACEDCGEIFTDATEFRSHYHTHTHPFHCSCCRHRFRSRVGYEVHVCEVEQQCDQCNMVFRSVQALNRHSTVHGPAPHTCTSCRRSYYRKESLDRHNCTVEADVNEYTKPKENPNFFCEVCGALLATKHSLNTHLRTAHGSPAAKNFNCDICGKQFFRKDLLREHQSVHAPPSFSCPTCKKMFKTRKYLEVHTLLHLGIKRFACKYCNKKFNQKVNLARHERSHMPRGAVKCQYCGAHCLSTNDLKEHLLSHTLPPDISPEEQEQTEEENFTQGRGSLPDKKQETFQSNPSSSTIQNGEIGAGLISHSPISTELKILSRTKDGLQTEQRTFSGPNSVIEAEQRLSTPPKVMGLTVKSRIETDFKESHVLESDYRAELVHQVVPVMSSDVRIEEGTSSRRQVDKHSVVPQTLSSLCLGSSEQTFANSYIISSESSSKAVTAEASSLCSTSNLSTSGNSLSTLHNSVLIDPSPIAPVTGSAHTYQIHTKNGGHRTVERNESTIHFESGQLEVVDSEPNKEDSQQTLHCHMLEGDVVQRVMLVTDPPVSDC